MIMARARKGDPSSKAAAVGSPSAQAGRLPELPGEVAREQVGEHGAVATDKVRAARYALGDIVRHRVFSFRGVVFDVDPVFNNTEEWYNSIPAHVRPRKDQPFYHLLARNAEATYQAYVSEQNLLADAQSGPVAHPLIDDLFDGMQNGRYSPRPRMMM
jgi:heat shock protein HspQ